MKNILMLTLSLLAVAAQAETTKCRVIGFGEPGKSYSILNKDVSVTYDSSAHRSIVFHENDVVQIRYHYGSAGSYLQLTDKVTGQGVKSFIDGKNSGDLDPSVSLENSNGGLVGNKDIKALSFGCDRKILK